MCDCLRSAPLAFSVIIIKAKIFGLNSSNLRQHSISLCISNVNSRLKCATTKASREVRFKEKDEERNNFELETDLGSSGLEILELEQEKKKGVEEDLVQVEDGNSKIEEGTRRKIVKGRRGKQVIKRSNILAKQVISIQSAHSLGFVSEIWVDITTWVVLVVEARPNLLSGESERFLLEDISQVGDVVLVEDEKVMENEIKMIGLETLIGYRVVTPGRRNVGKVRGYSFNINSGAVESLELDSFGISIIPSSLVSTYALPIEDVLEVLSDTVVVHEAAASHIQRLTKGFWDAQKMGSKIDELREYSDESDHESSVTPHRRQSTQPRSGHRKVHPKLREREDEWELPMDYL